MVTEAHSLVPERNGQTRRWQTKSCRHANDLLSDPGIVARTTAFSQTMAVKSAIGAWAIQRCQSRRLAPGWWQILWRLPVTVL